MGNRLSFIPPRLCKVRLACKWPLLNFQKKKKTATRRTTRSFRPLHSHSIKLRSRFIYATVALYCPIYTKSFTPSSIPHSLACACSCPRLGVRRVLWTSARMSRRPKVTAFEAATNGNWHWHTLTKACGRTVRTVMETVWHIWDKLTLMLTEWSFSPILDELRRSETGFGPIHHEAQTLEVIEG